MNFKLPDDLKKINFYLQDKKGVWIVKKYHPKRTNLQNRYMHAIFNMIAKETGYTMEEVKQIYKRKFLSYEKEVNGIVTKFVKNTRDLDTKEETDFIEKIRNSASADLGIYVPAPHESDYEQFLAKYE